MKAFSFEIKYLNFFILYYYYLKKLVFNLAKFIFSQFSFFFFLSPPQFWKASDYVADIV